MAARKNRGTLDKPWEDSVRSKIQTSMLINRLTDFVKGEVKLDPAQVTAALGLLKKSVPDLTSIDATIEGEIMNYVISGEPMSEDDWEATYGVATADGAAESTH